jgi:hypothetical protein
MKISDWLDEKEAEKLDVSQIALPDDLSYDKVPDETIFLRRLIFAGFSVQAIIPFLRSSALDTGIIVEVETRRPAFTRQEWRFFTKDRDLAIKTAKSHIE